MWKFLDDESHDTDWPLHSPAPNPIKHLWCIMSEYIHHEVLPQTIQELTEDRVCDLGVPLFFFFLINLVYSGGSCNDMCEMCIMQFLLFSSWGQCGQNAVEKMCT